MKEHGLSIIMYLQVRPECSVAVNMTTDQHLQSLLKIRRYLQAGLKRNHRRTGACHVYSCLSSTPLSRKGRYIPWPPDPAMSLFCMLGGSFWALEAWNQGIVAANQPVVGDSKGRHIRKAYYQAFRRWTCSGLHGRA